jgi:hypothetical protein
MKNYILEFNEKVKIVKELVKSNIEQKNNNKINNDTLKNNLVNHFTQYIQNVTIEKKILKKFEALLIEIENQKMINEIKDVEHLKNYMNNVKI